LILVEVSRFDIGGEQRIALQIERLAAAGLDYGAEPRTISKPRAQFLAD
jgi:hypothetical protein